MNKLALSFALAVTSALGAATAAHAQTPTVITSLPYVITAAGDYVLNRNLSSSQTSGNLITVDANNVTIDLQGHFISGPAGNTNQGTFGVSSQEHSNLTIRNGIIANCYAGVFLGGNGTPTTNNLNHQFNALRVTRCLSVGIQLNNAPGSGITGCQFSQIGVSNVSGATAINIVGAGVTVQNCAVSQALGMDSIGIYSDAGSFTRQCTISKYTTGVRSGKYQDNLTFGCAVPFSEGADAGGNN